MPTLFNPDSWVIRFEDAIRIFVALAVPIALALVLHWLVFAILRRVTRASASGVDDAIISRLRRPVRWTMVAMGVAISAGTDALVGEGWQLVSKYAVPALLGWTAYALVDGIADGLELSAEQSDAVELRARRTRISLLGRTAKIGVLLITIALILLNVPGVRQVGVTLMASAGLAALVVGAAAQPALKSFIAGIRMAMTQPVRLGDMVKIDGQAGRVEEIRMSFVTVRTWDERLLMVPTSRFLDETFENWSRVSERLTGSVFLHLDPATEIAPIRAEFERFVASRQEWDSRTAGLVMTDARPEGIELRLSVSAATIASLSDLRFAVREHMIDWLRREMPGALLRASTYAAAAGVEVTASSA